MKKYNEEISEAPFRITAVRINKEYPEKADLFEAEYNLQPKTINGNLCQIGIINAIIKAADKCEIPQSFIQDGIDNWVKSQEKKENKLNKENKDDDTEPIFTSFIHLTNSPEILLEQVFEPVEKKIMFAKYNKEDGSIEYIKEYKHDNILYQPIQDEEVLKEAIQLPSQALDYTNEEEIDNDIKQFINKWLDIPEDFLHFTVWNIKKSWLYDRFHTLNYLRALGDTGQGKTRFLDTLGILHYKPIATSGATTSAPVFRIINKWHPTLIIDEADFQKSDESQDIIKIINQGYEKNKCIMRCDQNDASKIQFFDTYCPKILATRRPFQDKAVESRCITTIMKGTVRKDIKFTLNNSFYNDARIIRNKLLMYRFKNYFVVDPEKEIEFDFGDIEPRVQQIVSSYVNLFGHNEEQLNAFKKYITDYQESLIEERKSTFEGAIIESLTDLIDKGAKYVTCEDLISNSAFTDHNGKPMKPRALSSFLKVLGLEVGKAIKYNGKTIKPINYTNNQLYNLRKRYGYQVTEVTVYMESGSIGNFSEKTAKNDIVTNRVSPPKDGNNGNSVTNGKDFDEIMMVSNKNNIVGIITENLSNVPIQIQTFYDLFCKSISEEMFEKALKELKLKGDIAESPAGYIFKIV